MNDILIVLRCINCNLRFGAKVTTWLAQAMLFRGCFERDTGCFRMLCTECGTRKRTR